MTRYFMGLASLLISGVLADSLPASETHTGNLYQGATKADVARSGWPWCHWVWARPQNPCHYTGYYVGGGAPGPRSRPPCPDEGTWGWDYHGIKIKRLVRLGWTSPPRSQGSTGSYDPDGPRVAEAIHETTHSLLGTE